MLKHFLLVLVGVSVVQAQRQRLEGTRWILAYYVRDNQIGRVTPDRSATAEFTGGDLRGSTGCNPFGAMYTQEDRALRFGPVRQTLRACLDDALDVQEQGYVKGLERVRSFRLTRGVLSLLDEAGKTVLIFTEARPMAILGSWMVTAINTGDAIQSVTEGSSLTATFRAGMGVSGSTGCNRFSAPVVQEGFNLKIGPTVSTRRGCSSDAESKQEGAFLKTLEAVAGFRIMGNRLELYALDGRTLIDLMR